MGYFDVLDRIKPAVFDTGALSTITADVGSGLPGEREIALVVDTPDRTIVTVPITANALSPAPPATGSNPPALDSETFLTRIRGRLVGAEQANRNGQFWSTGDLVFGMKSVVGGPLNWLHQDRKIIGALTDAELIRPTRAAAAAGQWPHPYIAAGSVVWSYLFPGETQVIREAAAQNKLYYSMECVSGSVQCFGEKGCGRVVAYADATNRNENCCDHIRAKASTRRFIDPVFQGAAVIVPPVAPGWADANVELLRRANASAETMQFADGDENLAAQILEFVRAGAKD